MRKGKVLIVRLHSGHHPVLGANLHRLDPDIGSARPTCKEEDHTLHDWLITRLAVDCLRQKIFGCPRERLEWVITCPKHRYVHQVVANET